MTSTTKDGRKSGELLIRRAGEGASQPVTMAGADGVRMQLLVGRDDGAPNFAMRHFEVEPGGHTPHHQHNYEHEVFVVAGEGEATYGDTKTPIKSGDVLFVEANVMHQFQNKGDGPLRFLCLVPVQFDCGNGEVAPTPGS